MVTTRRDDKVLINGADEFNIYKDDHDLPIDWTIRQHR